MESDIVFTCTLDDIDWELLTAALQKDNFDNGRSPEQLQRSFANSQGVCFAWADGRVIGKARVLSDGVCNAYVVDVWTLSDYRRRGIASEMMRSLLQDLPGQHVYLQADEDVLAFYNKLGFRQQPHGLSVIVGDWLDNTSVTQRRAGNTGSIGEQV